MNLVNIARETIRVTKEKSYQTEGETVFFPKKDYEEVLVITPKMGENLLSWDIRENYRENHQEEDQKMRQAVSCEYEVINADSFQAASRLQNPLVMNFANAHVPGGGFLMGATAQEEALCRCSTLYASIHSKMAAEMYHHNNTHLHPVESDYMLLSPNVLVFRNERCEFLKEPFSVGVITIPAPNRYGAAMFATGKMISDTMIRRIRIMLRLAAQKGYQDLVLGAWGCGAFGNDPGEVAGYFHQVLVDEGYGNCFRKVCFAVYGKENGKNITAFRNVFQGK